MITQTAPISWWNQNPQEYGDAWLQHHDEPYYRAIDEGVFGVRYDGNIPYDRLIDHLIEPHRYKGKRTLEIGFGTGWMLERLARYGALVSGIDPTEAANRLTRRRFELRGLTGDIRQGVGEQLPYENGTFDLVYSIGVLHHTPTIDQALREVHRVLKPGGRLVLMLYSRESVFYQFLLWIRGRLELESLFLDEQTLVNRWTDGWEADGNLHSKPVSVADLRQLLTGFDDVRYLSFYFNLPMQWAHYIPAVVRRLFAKRYGWFRYVLAVKPTA